MRASVEHVSHALKGVPEPVILFRLVPERT